MSSSVKCMVWHYLYKVNVCIVTMAAPASQGKMTAKMVGLVDRAKSREVLPFSLLSG